MKVSTENEKCVFFRIKFSKEVHASILLLTYFLKKKMRLYVITLHHLTLFFFRAGSDPIVHSVGFKNSFKKYVL